ncbi:MAG: DUF5106 domain-containing protein [Alistipes senegalensis]
MPGRRPRTCRAFTCRPSLRRSLSPEGRRDYLRLHYWDGFDFADTLFLARADTSGMFETFARYVMVLSDRPTDPAPMDSLMRRAAVSRPMLDYFSMLADGVLHDPNSPLRNDEFYIPVLRAQLAAPWYDEYERIAPSTTWRWRCRTVSGSMPTISAIRSLREPEERCTGCRPNTCCFSSTTPAARCAAGCARRSPRRRCSRR